MGANYPFREESEIPSKKAYKKRASKSEALFCGFNRIIYRMEQKAIQRIDPTSV